MPSAGRIDVHFHLIPPFYRDAVYEAGTGPAIGRYPDWSPQLALELMDQYGIEIAMTSLAQPGVQFGTVESSRGLARKCNDYAADLTASWPQRFGALAVVPMGNMQHAVEEIAYALDGLKFDGVCLFASYGEKFLGDSLFDPVLEILNDRDAVVFIHPALHPSSRKLDLAWPGFMMEYLFDTTRAAVNLVFTKALERFPRIRFILAHAGGVLPYFAWRLSVSPMIDPRLPQFSRTQILDGLKHYWFDNALSPGPQTMDSLVHVALPERIVFGTDWPFANGRVIAAAIDTHVGSIAEPQRSAIDHSNAQALFPRLAG
jgi:predicted TIM-barrel fold metal-dependent hydrolase